MARRALQASCIGLDNQFGVEWEYRCSNVRHETARQPWRPVAVGVHCSPSVNYDVLTHRV